MTYLGPGNTMTYTFQVVAKPPEGIYYPVFSVASQIPGSIIYPIEVQVDFNTDPGSDFPETG